VYARTYAQILGVVLILVGLVGLALGNVVWGGILNVDIVEDIVHLITGGLLAFVGFGRVDLSVTRNVVGLLGIIYLMVGVLGFAAPTMFGLIPHGYTAFDNLLHLVLGGLSLAVAWWFFGDERGVRTQSQAEESEEL
jgi:drug/metabolite transporter (DMT)-like permease